MIRYTPEHLWIRLDDGGMQASAGITPHAQDTLGDIVFVELPKPGLYAQNAVVGLVESTKTASDLHMPVAGTIVSLNEVLRAQPELLNTDPLGEGWIFRLECMQPDAFSTLMDAEAYAAFTGA